MGRNAVTKERNLNPKKRDLYIVKLTETFKKHGLKKYSMDSIASELKVSKATLYHYFSSKDSNSFFVIFSNSFICPITRINAISTISSFELK